MPVPENGEGGIKGAFAGIWRAGDGEKCTLKMRALVSMHQRSALLDLCGAWAIDLTGTAKPPPCIYLKASDQKLVKS